MSQYFQHTPQATSVVNQVENLAAEVDTAFLEIEELLYQDDQENASLNSSIGSLDNKYIKEYVPNKGLISNYEQDLYFPRNSQEASLDLFPSLLVADLNTVVVTNQTVPATTYTYKVNGILENANDFTFIDKKVVFGKSPESNEALTITYKGYNTTSTDDDINWPFELRYNILQVKQFNNTIVRDFTYTTAGTEKTVSGYNFRDMCSTFIKSVIDTNPLDLIKYVAVFDSNGNRINITTISITTTFVKFNTIDTISTPTVKIYVANASLGELVECIYRLFYSHDHGTNGGDNINHGALLGLYENTYDVNGNPVINYKVSDKLNYDHPQYLNREGFVQDPDIYNNAFLGDLLLASTESGNRRNNLNANSVKLVFGEYASGHKMYFNQSDDCLWVDSISKDGVKLLTPPNKRALSINDHSFVDTNILSPDTDRALKLTLKSETDLELGVLQLTRKRIVNNVSTDDDKAKLLSYASEFSFTLIKDTLTIDNGAKISFGSPSVIDIVKENDGLHFQSPDVGTSTGASDVHFDVKVFTSELVADHLDANEIHLKADQKIVFNTNTHDSLTYDYINYDTELNIKSTKAVNFKNNGRLTGLSLDNRQYVYTSTPQGSYISDTVEPTDLYVETKRDTYFIKTGYPFTQGVTNLQTVPKSDIYCGNTVVENVVISFDENLTRGVVLNATNKILSHRDELNNLSTIVQSNAGLVVVNSYLTTDTVLNYGKVTAKEFIAKGDMSTSAGFTGNIIVPLNHKLTVNGLTEFTNDLTFNKPVEFKDYTKFKEIDADDITVKRLDVTETANYEELIVNNLEVETELRFNNMLQTNPIAHSKFEGTVEFVRDVKIISDSTITIGDSDIEDTRNTDGLLLSSNEVKLGTNGKVSAAKFIAGKGAPSGNGDETGGYAFSSTTGLPDGDTGMFAENNIDSQNDSDIVFRIDGVEKVRIPKTPTNLDAGDLSARGNDVVTVDMLLSRLQDITSVVLESVYPIGSIYSNTVDSRDPKLILNWPSSNWRRHAIGRAMIGAEGTAITDKVDANLNKPAALDLMTSGAKFGDFTHTLTVPEMPHHKHRYTSDDAAGAPGGSTGRRMGADFSQKGHSGSAVEWFTTMEFPLESGGDGPHNNVQPSVVTHIWERLG